MPPHHPEVVPCSPTNPFLPHALGLSVLREPDPPLGTQLPSYSGFQLLYANLHGEEEENPELGWALGLGTTLIAHSLLHSFTGKGLKFREEAQS